MSAALFLGLLGHTAPLAAENTSTPGLELAYSLERATQGLSISEDGRKSISQRYSTTLPPQIVELLDDNSTVLYSNTAWNSYNSSDPTSDPCKTFLGIDGSRMGPDGRYWTVNGSTKLVGANLTNDAVDKLYYLDAMKASDSGIDDVRYNAAGDVAYMSDTAGALLVMNMTTGRLNSKTL
ncbi:uncharacterized protein BO88DRAFT_479382 [Aspergillus vadensis CBS 113365]|uniref:Major royal jelly protein n=1 Tax=Aspergillus vadensis (strain CBS 113365 / IMI 142717 / IBT 24658) TaxID=1448311 RepID=A0A319BEN4_ASPVC|nr:hypothetical protein BO88DRAFT_479382 [Aspergillus vadensis CBS 113365]PYH71195.1 hypothetical protein BO88DRAFT_479382 [Aspergillus vadensis CBS 113365]